MIEGIVMLLGMIVLDKIDPALNTMLAVIGGIWALLVFGARLVDNCKPTDPTTDAVCLAHEEERQRRKRNEERWAREAAEREAAEQARLTNGGWWDGC